jgi:uncharacterized protein
MPAYYMDTSALVKRYAAEVGTAWATSLIVARPIAAVFTVRLTGPETIAALERKVRTGEASRREMDRAITRFESDWRWRFELIEAGPDLTDHAMRLVRRYPLRGYDAVHLAAALTADDVYRRRTGTRVTLISADRDQLQAAQAEGVLVDDPNTHP